MYDAAVKLTTDPNAWVLVIGGGIIVNAITFAAKYSRLKWRKRQRRSKGPVFEVPEGYDAKFWSFIRHYPRVERAFVASDFQWNELRKNYREICELCDALAKCQE